jgi:hypothetical protein
VEIFVDFGLFELLVMLGLVAVARKIYARRVLGSLFLLASVLLPIVLLLLVRTELTRWLAAACVATALVNAARIFSESSGGANILSRFRHPVSAPPWMPRRFHCRPAATSGSRPDPSSPPASGRG